MQPAIACPEADQLRQLAQGVGSADEIEAFAQHLGACATCAESLDTLDAQSDIGRALRAGSEAIPLDADIEAMMARLQKLANDTSASPAGPFSTVPGAPTPTPREDDPSTMLAPPQGPGEIGRIGSYRVLAVLGAGGMGMVFHAEDTTLKRPVALKVMRPALAASATARQRFLREAQSAAAVRHDHIVTIYHASEAGGIAYLAMELLDGESLEQRLQREAPLPIAEAVRIGQQIAAGLAAAHKPGLIHRDIKPSNIWLEREGDRVKLLDFGLARSADGDAHLTQSGAVVGTPAYMAPEQTEGGKVDARSDLFSLGCVLYQMVTGQRPFHGATNMAVMRAVAFDDPKPPREINAKIHPELAALIDRLLAKDPAKRPASAREVAQQLGAIAALPPPPLDATEELPPAVADAASLPGKSGAVAACPTKPARRRPMLAAAAVAFLIFGPLTWFYGGTVIRIATNKGELVIENADPNVEVTIKGKTATICDKVKDRRFVLSAGEYDVEVREEGDGGVRFATKRFTITRSGKETFEARLELAKQNPADADRKTAEWVLSIGGKIEVWRGDILAATITKKDQLAALQLGNLNLVLNSARIDDTGLACLRSLQSVTGLQIGSWPLTVESWKTIGSILNVKSLGLAGTTLDDSSLLELRKLKALNWVNASDTELTDAGLEVVPEFAKLRYLDLEGTKVTAKGVAKLRKAMPECDIRWAEQSDRKAAEWVLSIGGRVKVRVDGKTVDVVAAKDLPAASLQVVGVDLAQNLKVTDAGLTRLKDLTNLTWLGLAKTRVTDAGLVHLERLKNLESLDLNFTGVSDVGMAHIKTLTHLASLYLGKTKVGDVGLESLKGLTNLTTLHLYGTGVSDAGLERLKSLTQLENLSLYITQVSDGGLKCLKSLTKLTGLDLRETNVTATGVDALRKALPKCNIVTDFLPQP